MRKKIVIRPLIREKFQEFLQGQRILFFSAPCGFGKTTVAEALLSGRAVLRRSGEDEDPIPEKGDWNILLVDDFLANGEALRGLCEIVSSAGAELVGMGVAVEKGFQPGGKKLRDAGIPLYSLAIIEKADGNGIVFRDGQEEK